MENITVSVPSSVRVDLKHHTEAMEASLEGKSAEWFGWAIAFALRQSAGDADAGLKDETIEAKREAVWTKFHKLASGEIPKGGRGPTGSRLGNDAEALHQFLVAKGNKGKKGDLEKRLLGYVETMILNAVDLPEELRVELRKPENRDELLAAARERYDDAIEAIKASKLYAAKLASIEAEEEAEEIVVKTAPGLKIG